MADLPSSLMDKLFGWCLSLFLAALALYGAVQLICAIWPVLVICLIVAWRLWGWCGWSDGWRGAGGDCRCRVFHNSSFRVP